MDWLAQQSNNYFVCMFHSVIHLYMIQLLQYIFITLRDDKITKCKRGFSKSKKKNLLLIQVIYKHKIFILSFDMLHLQLVPMISENQFHHFLNFQNFFLWKFKFLHKKPTFAQLGIYDMIYKVLGIQFCRNKMLVWV